MLWKYKIGSNIICEGQLYELILGIKEDFLLFLFFFLLFNSEIIFLMRISDEVFATY